MCNVSHCRHKPWLWLLIALSLLSLAGCGGTPRGGEALDAAIPFEHDIAFDLQRPRAYRIGINTEVTGTGAQIGDLSIRAARLAVEEINAAGGVDGIPLELVVRDCRSTPAVAVEQYRQAISEDQLVALLGPLKSAYAMPIVPEHRASSLPVLIGATNAHLTEQGDTHLFRMRPSDRLTAAAMVTLAVDQLAARRIGIVFDSDAFGSGGAEQVAAALARRRMTLAASASYVTGATDFDAPVQLMLAAQVDTLLVYGTNSTDVGALLRAIRYWRLGARIITTPGGASTVTRNVAAEAQDGIYVATDAIFTNSAAGIQFEQSFTERFGLAPDTYIAWYYDAIYLLARALGQRPTDTSDLSAAIRATVYQGAQGAYHFDAAGEGLHQVALARMEQGRPRLVGYYGARGFVAVRPALSGVRRQLSVVSIGN